MTFLTPTAAIIAGAVAVPLLVVLYLLKLKRREVPISCTLFWKRAVQDLQVNAPFQRLRRNILLLLQLLALTALILALASPMLAWRGGSGDRYVILIDRSASMSATDMDGSRLDAAKQQARDFVQTLRPENILGALSGGDQAMVIAFADRPEVLCTFTANHRRILDAIDSIQRTDGPSKIAEAVRIARAFAIPTDPDAMERPTVDAAKLVLFSDGCLADSDKIVLRDDEMIVHPVGQSADNLAVAAMQVRRAYDDPDQLSVYARIENFRPERAECDVELILNAQTIGLKHLTLPAAKPVAGPRRALPGQGGVLFTLRRAESGVLEVRQRTADALAADDAAWAIVPEARRLTVMLVTPGNLVVENALRSLPVARVDVRSGEEFDTIDPVQFETTRPADVVVLDRHAPKNLPRCGYLVFGRPPALEGLTSAGPQQDQFILDWRINHPVLRFVNLENVFAETAWRLNLPDDAHILAESDRGTVIAMLTRRGSRFLLVNFDPLESNWPFRPSFVMFLYNAARQLAAQGGDLARSALAVGESFTVQAPPGTTELRITAPDGTTVQRRPDATARLRYADLDRVGIYRVTLPKGQTRSFAVNLFDSAESNIAPPTDVTFAGERVAAQTESIERANSDLRPLLVIIALLVLCLEWFVYNKKVQI